MACTGCAARRRAAAEQQKKTYLYTSPTGTKKVYRDKREADAAVIRNGGSYKVQ